MLGRYVGYEPVKHNEQREMINQNYQEMNRIYEMWYRGRKIDDNTKIIYSVRRMWYKKSGVPRGFNGTKKDLARKISVQ